MNKFTTAFACLGLLLSVSALSAQEAKFPPVPSAPCVAHRGFSAVAPENTIASLKKAIEVGAQGSETDVYTTTDGVLFCMHDGNLKRTTGLDKPCAQVDFPTLATLDNSNGFDEFKGEHVATFDQYLATLKGTKTRPIIEVKQNGFSDKIVAYVRAYDMVDEAIVIDFSAERVAQVRQLEPNLCCAWLTSLAKDETPVQCAERIVKTLKKINTNVVDVHFGAVNEEFLKKPLKNKLSTAFV